MSGVGEDDFKRKIPQSVWKSAFSCVGLGDVISVDLNIYQYIVRQVHHVYLFTSGRCHCQFILATV